MKKVALISGITGQDGSFLAEFLIEKGYEVHGILRRSSSFNTGRIEHLYLDEWVRDMQNSLFCFDSPCKTSVSCIDYLYHSVCHLFPSATSV